MTEERLFQYILSRMQGRASVATSTATIASSASLVLIALFSSAENFAVHAIVLGILFPLAGLVWIEITYRTIHRDDHDLIRELITKELGKKETDEKTISGKYRNLRFALNRYLLAMPIFGWFFIIDDMLQLDFLFAIFLSEITFLSILLIVIIDKEFFENLKSNDT